VTGYTEGNIENSHPGEKIGHCNNESTAQQPLLEVLIKKTVTRPEKGLQ
jgi:hypothetical protein